MSTQLSPMSMPLTISEMVIMHSCAGRGIPGMATMNTCVT